MTTITGIMTTIRECMDDHGITVAQAAEWAGMSEDDMRQGLNTGEMGIDRLTPIYDRTGDMRAYGCTPRT
ncbi:hypothetical protein BSP239C_03484 [Brevibacterium sp. 239c]|uniref:hypothetical protein n=1 Tax=Brevibacterium sp. 239c TaxID=1965356 RepID=UPI000C37F8BC|nr:hypothetical protein [Brevibacterium sp. 239c]SMY03245.1 hypothetical protein BSP239C_03484 [Brevibacterium sp. 239c]